MATAREIKESQHITRVKGRDRAERIFEILPGVAEELDASVAAAATDLPLIDDAFSAQFPGLLCVQVDLRHHPGINQYAANAIYESDPTVFDPQITTFIEYVDAWRGDVTLSLPNPSPYQDIGGTPIDQAGQPVRVPIHRVKIGLQKLYTAFTIEDLPWDVWRRITGSVNEDIFHDAPQQTLKYLGAQNTTLRPGKQLVTHEFLYDSFFHFHQEPKILQKNYVDMTFDLTFEVWHATEVYWRRVARIEDFGMLGV